MPIDLADCQKIYLQLLVLVRTFLLKRAEGIFYFHYELSLLASFFAQNLIPTFVFGQLQDFQDCRKITLPGACCYNGHSNRSAFSHGANDFHQGARQPALKASISLQIQRSPGSGETFVRFLSQ